MIISRVHIEKFRKLRNVEFGLGEKVTVIAGQNGTMKSTLLGLIGQPFSMKDKTNPMTQEKTIDGSPFESKFSDKFKFSDAFDQPGDHEWLIHVNEDIYPKGVYTAVSIARMDKDAPNAIRIWSKEGRDKGMGYIQCPVIFLSLKRLIPVGEEKSFKTSEIQLTDDERAFFEEYHNKILLLSEQLTSVEHIKSSNKSSLGAKTAEYDILTNSSGQDNIGKILLTILSFKRLKERFPDEYKGGILLIDELDATMFPAAQEKLFEALFRFASDYALQIILTTHSPYVIKLALSDKYSRAAKLLYLRKRESGIVVNENPAFEEIEADLKVSVLAAKPTRKIRVYCEDMEAYTFLSNVIPRGYKSKLELMRTITIGCSMLKELAKKKIPEFVHSLVVLDGDQEQPKYKNFCVLPGKGASPEKLFFQFLKSLTDEDAFWDDPIGGYTRQICFKDFGAREPQNRIEYKEWFNSQVPYWGTDCVKMILRWKEDHCSEVALFQERFVAAFECLEKIQNSKQS